MALKVEAHKLAKKKETKVANPVEAYGQAPKSGVEGEVPLANKSLKPQLKGNEALACGYASVGPDVDSDLDPFDNLRNYERVSQDDGFGPDKKTFEQDGEDYNHPDRNEKVPTDYDSEDEGRKKY